MKTVVIRLTFMLLLGMLLLALISTGWVLTDTWVASQKIDAVTWTIRYIVGIAYCFLLFFMSILFLAEVQCLDE